MTSPRYLNDKADSKDLVRSFVKAIPYAVIALVVLSIQHIVEVVQLVTSPEFRMNKASSQIISYFGNGGFLYPDLILYGMVLCGIIISVVLFRFMLSKKSVNVYFSMGITRTRLYINRIIAGVLALMLAVLIPIGIVLIINLVSFGASGHLFEVFFYEFSVLFVSGLAGFAIATVASTFSGSLVEMALNTAAISALPTIISTVALHLPEYALKGYIGMYRSESYAVNVIRGRMFSPWKFAVDLDIAKAALSDVADKRSLFLSSPYNDMADLLEKTVPESKLLDAGLMLPIFVWVIISAVLLALGYVLINKRKAEHANSFGRFYISAAVLGTTAFAGAATLLLMIFGEISTSLTSSFTESGLNPMFGKTGLCLVLSIIALLIVFFVVELIVRRKLKSTIRMWPVFAGLVLVSLVVFGYFASEKFGTFNKVPAASDVKEIALDVYDPKNNFPTHIFSGEAYMSSDEKDIAFALDQFKKISASKKVDGKDQTTVTFKFVLKNNKEILRSFTVYDSALFEEYARGVYATDYYKSNMKFLMLNEPKRPQDENWENGMYYDDGFGGRVYTADYADTYYEGMLRDQQWKVASPDGIVDNAITGGGGIDGNYYSENELPVFDDNEALMKALYNDLTKLSFEETYMNPKRPVAILFTSCSEANYADGKFVVYNDYGYNQLMPYDEYQRNVKGVNQTETKNLAGEAGGGWGGNLFYVYDNMTETLELLKAHGFDVNTHAAKIKEVYYTDSKLAPEKVMDLLCLELSKTNKDFYYWRGSRLEGNLVSEVFNQGIMLNSLAYSDYFGFKYQGENEKTITMLDIVTSLYSDYNHPLKKADTAEKAQQISDKSVPFFCSYRDDGRYAFIIYEDNVITCRYIPSANVSVLG